MLTFPPRRHQGDRKGDIQSDKAALVFDTNDPDARSTTRQEYKKETDINYILGRFGVGPQKPLNYGTADYEIDLQNGLDAVRESQRAWKRLPADLKKRFPTWLSLLRAIDIGEFTITNEKPEDQAPPAPPIVPPQP